MDEKALKVKVLEKSRDGKLTCAAAHELSEELGVPLSVIGKACNEAEPRIKIKACQLGCF